jgi:Uma2 family endonuclease
MTAQPHPVMSVEEYLAFEEASPVKYEYFAGRIVALAGGNEAHSIICSNINALLHAQLRQRPYLPSIACRLRLSELYEKVTFDPQGDPYTTP